MFAPRVTWTVSGTTLTANHIAPLEYSSLFFQLSKLLAAFPQRLPFDLDTIPLFPGLRNSFAQSPVYNFIRPGRCPLALCLHPATLVHRLDIN